MKRDTENAPSPLKILHLEGYTIPVFGSDHCLPYGKLCVTDGKHQKLCEIHETADGDQYILWDRKRRRVTNVGRLFSPIFKFVD